jgi:hypothetical protein
MKTIVVYKDKSDHARAVIDFLRDFKSRTGIELETIDPETPSGVSFCEAYDIVAYPTVISISEENIMQQMWVGVPLPTIMEVSYYV